MRLASLCAWMLLAGSMALGSNSAVGQNFPSKPIRILATGAGGGGDFASRLIAQGLTVSLGRQVLVENRGGSVIIPAQIVAQAPPDGHTLLVYASTFWILPLLQEVPYDKSGFTDGGFKIYDIADRTAPRLLVHQKTGGVGVHRFDMDENYAYISTEMDGYLGNILVTYDIRDPRHPAEVSRWWLPGQHIAGGETPTWHERSHRLHHALRRGDRMWAGVWQAGMRVVDVSDITRPRTIGAYNYHPPFKDPTHTFMPLNTPIGGRDIAVTIDEEERYYNLEVSEQRRGRVHACISMFDVTDVGNIQPLSLFQVSELDSP